MMLLARSRFADAAGIYLVKIVERREDSTYDTYRHWIDTVVLPALGKLRIHECDVAQLDAYFTDLQRRATSCSATRQSFLAPPTHLPTHLGRHGAWPIA